MRLIEVAFISPGLSKTDFEVRTTPSYGLEEGVFLKSDGQNHDQDNSQCTTFKTLEGLPCQKRLNGFPAV